MGAIIDRIKEWWLTADQTQKLVTAFGLAFLVAILGFTIFFSTRPKMQVIYTGLSETDKAGIYEELQKGGFKVDVDGPAGEIKVPTQDVSRAKMLLAQKNKLPKSTSGGIEIINSLGITDSQNKEREKIKAAYEQEIEASISTMDNIAAAQVHLSPGKDAPFGDQIIPASASIRLTESNEGSVGPEQAKSIARLVQHAILNLSPEGITIVTNSGRIIFDGQEENSSLSISNHKIEAEQTLSKKMSDDLQSELDNVFGIGNTTVSVKANVNMDTIKINKNEQTPSDDPFVKEKATETMAKKDDEASGEAGFAANDVNGNAIASSTQGDGNNYESSIQSEQRAITTTQTATEKAAGELTALNVIVMANSEALDATAVTALEERINQEIAPYQGDPKFTASVTAVPFNTEASKIQEKAAAEAASAQRMQQVISILPVAALLLVGIILMKSLGKTFKRPAAQRMVLSNGQTISLPEGADPELVALIESAAGPIQSSSSASLPGITNQIQQASQEEQEEEVEVEEETGEFDDEGEPVVKKVKKKRKKRLYDDDDDDEELDIEGIKRKVDIPLEQIKKMSKKNPEAVAMLVKSWVMEER